MAHTRRALLASTAAAVALAGCLGDDDDDGGNGDETPTDTPNPTATETPTQTGTPTEDTTVAVSEHPDHGDILVDEDGLTLYMFDADEPGSGESACYDDCATNWPPLTVEDEPVAGPEVSADLSTIEREDGSMQVVANGWPLYYWAGDSQPGDATGHGVQDVWWVLRPDGSPVRPVDVAVRAHPDHGDILVDGEGLTLYMFDVDEPGAGESACTGDCLDNWPPLTLDGEARVGDDVSASVSTFERSDGSMQVTANGWPLYYFAGDDEPGDATGQGIEDVWWVLDPAGDPQREPEDTPTPGGGGGGPY